MTKVTFLRFMFLILSLVLVFAVLARGASIHDFAVEVSATAEESPPRIDFSWVSDASAGKYHVYRKSIGDTAWTGPVAVLEGSATSWADTDVAVGEAYEYSFRKVECIITDTVAVTGGAPVTFTIHDTWGDGICCDMGLGHYEVSGCGVVYASGGVFGSSESTPFTAGTAENPCDTLIVHITLDIFGAETRYELTEDASGDTLSAGGLYSSPRFGNVLAGICYEAPDDWGAVLLLVDEPVADSLASELRRLELDMIRDGYRVVRRDIPDGTSVPDVKDLIVANCQAIPDITTLFIFGDMAVPYSGNVKGAHLSHQGAWPADLYYGELDAVWTDTTVDNTNALRTQNHNVPGDGKFDQTFLPSDVDLQVGRVDLSNMPAFAESEIALLRRYLDKNHAFRSGAISVPHSGLIRDNVGIASGTAYACTGWRNFTAMFGSSHVRTDLWFPDLETNPRLFAYGCGGGSFTSCATVATTTDFATRTVYAVFTMMMGSYFGDWDSRNNLMRAALGAEGYPLTCCWAGRPAWLLHHMALGYPIGYSTRITQNNHLLYEIGYGGRQIHIALMGDPTLRLLPAGPPATLGLEALPGQAIRLTWHAPEEPVAGYHVYRAESLSGGFTRLSTGLIQDTTFVDGAPVSDLDLYMVRAAKLDTTASGTYFSLSPGIIDSIEVSAGIDALPIHNMLDNSPNPSAGATRISYHLAGAGPVLLRVHDVAGRLVREIDEGEREAGSHSFEWDGRDGNGHRVASGVYFLSLDTNSVTLSTKVVRLR